VDNVVVEDARLKKYGIWCAAPTGLGVGLGLGDSAIIWECKVPIF